MASATQVQCATLNCEQGLKTKFKSIVEWADSMKLDFLALQETGECPPNLALLRAHKFSMHHSPFAHAGTAIIIQAKWAPYVRRVFNHDTGRLVGVLVQSLNRSIIIISVYMPTSLDSCGDDSEEADLALSLYNTIAQWTSECPRGTRVVVMGDLNETIDKRDRSSVSPHCNRFIRHLSHLTDTYRIRHPSHGFTCTTVLPDGGRSQSRLDYIWVSPSIFTLSCSVISSPVKSRHSSVLARLTIDIRSPASHPVVHDWSPNLRAATEEQVGRCVGRVERWCMENRSVLDSLAVCHRG
jgi:exonuclease III